MQNLNELPKDLPVPVDDGACNHLLGLMLPSVALSSTGSETSVDLSTLLSTRVVIYCYPMTGRPGHPLPDGWNEVPGARGCTPQSCSFRDQYHELQSLNARVYGVSTQGSEYQREAAERLHLPFPLLSDSALVFASFLNLPWFEIGGVKLLKRVTLIVEKGRIVKYFYPVFPPNNNVNEVLQWLRTNVGSVALAEPSARIR